MFDYVFVVEKPQFVKRPEDQNSQDFAEVLVKVRATGVPKPEIKWTKNGEPMDMNNRDSSKALITVESSNDTHVTSELLVKHFSAEHSADYEAIAYNIAGETVAPFKLTLKNSAPAFEKKLERQVDVAEEEKLTLACSVSGSPLPEVAWFKNGEPLEPSDQ